MSDDGRMGLVLLKFAEEDKQNFAQNSEPIAVLRQLTAEVQSRHPGTKLGLTGLPIIEFDEMRSSESSMSLATVLSFLGVLAIMIVAFGGVRHATMAMLALVMAMIWTCGCIAVDGRAHQRAEHRFRLDPFRAGHRLRHLLRHPLSATPQEHGIDQRSPGGHGRQHGTGRPDRRRRPRPSPFSRPG